MSHPGKTMLFVGDQWLGSNARSLCLAFRRMGWLVDVIDPGRYTPVSKSTLDRCANRLLSPLHVRSFNTAILERSREMLPAVVFVYKGRNVRPETLAALRQQNIESALYFPDFSLHAHGQHIPKCIPYYSQVFTAKSFGIDELQRLGARDIHLILHACDPDVHRPLDFSVLPSVMLCDVSFIGAWSPHKERVLAELVNRVSNLALKIWGGQWRNNSSPVLQGHIMHREVYGDLYAAAIQSSRINLGLLSEQRYGASSGDLTTARTFEIPGCRAFMLHERTHEVLQCFNEGAEIECFGDAHELAAKVKYYLAHENERLTVAEAGYQRCLRDHLIEHRARCITESLMDLGCRSEVSSGTRAS